MPARQSWVFPRRTRHGSCGVLVHGLKTRTTISLPPRHDDDLDATVLGHIGSAGAGVAEAAGGDPAGVDAVRDQVRSEERRVGKEWRSRGWVGHEERREVKRNDRCV